MNHKNKLQENNTNLQAILDLVNNMPEGGGGSGGGEGAIETCEVHVRYEVTGLGEYNLTCLFTELDSDGKPIVSCGWLTYDSSTTIQTLTLLKDSLFIYFQASTEIFSGANDDEWIYKIETTDAEIKVYRITEDTIIHLY